MFLLNETHTSHFQTLEFLISLRRPKFQIFLASALTHVHRDIHGAWASYCSTFFASFLFFFMISGLSYVFRRFFVFSRFFVKVQVDDDEDDDDHCDLCVYCSFSLSLFLSLSFSLSLLFLFLFLFLRSSKEFSGFLKNSICICICNCI